MVHLASQFDIIIEENFIFNALNMLIYQQQ